MTNELLAQGFIYPSTTWESLKVTVVDVNNLEIECPATQDNVLPEYAEQFTPEQIKDQLSNHAISGNINNVLLWLSKRGQPAEITCYACDQMKEYREGKIYCSALQRTLKTKVY